MRTIGTVELIWNMVRSLWFNRQLRRYLLQGLFLGAVLLLVTSSLANVYANLVRQGMAYGWDFLWRATGWRLSVAMLEQGLNDPYWWTILMGVVNTLALGLLCILCATVIGSGIGLLRLSTNPMLRLICTAYVDLLRNVPVIMQIYFWYEVFKHAPMERQALSFGGVFFASNRGLYFPKVQIEAGQGLLLIGLLLLALAALWLALKRHRPQALLAVAALAVLYLLWQGNPFSLQFPVLQGFGFRGGHRLPVEFLALFVAITIYSSAYVAEIVRGGLLAVDKGQIEAARALGLREATIHWNIRLPLAMRSALPPLSNQFLITMKVTSLGAAIGYADLFSVVSTSINHAGQTIELLALMMGGYLMINYVIARAMHFLNQHFALKGHGAAAPAASWLSRLLRRQAKPVGR